VLNVATGKVVVACGGQFCNLPRFHAQPCEGEMLEGPRRRGGGRNGGGGGDGAPPPSIVQRPPAGAAPQYSLDTATPQSRSATPQSSTATSASPSSPLFTVGDKIEGNYKGADVWYPGRITLVHEDGSVDIDYEDGSGDKEKAVPPCRVLHYCLPVKKRLSSKAPAVDRYGEASGCAGCAPGSHKRHTCGRGALPAPPPSLPPAASATAKPAAKPASGGGSATWSKGSPCQYPAESGGYRLGEVVTVNKTPGHLGVKPFHPRLAEVEVKTSLVRMWNVDDNSTVTDCPPLTKCLMSTPPADASEAEMFEYYENVERLKISFNCASIPAVVKMVESEAETLFA